MSLEFVISAVDEYTRTFDKMQTDIKRLAEGAKTLGVALSAIGVGLTAGITDAVKTGMEFDAQMSKVKAISGATTDEFKAMREQALALGASTSKSASEVADGFKEMSAMGFDATEVMRAMPGVIGASEASGADMAQVAQVMASTLNAFSLEASEASRVADVLAKTANVSAADITDMQYALKYAAGPANALGVSLEELSAAVGIMVDRGASGEQAGTTLRASLLRLVDPPKEAASAMSKLGFSAIDASGQFKPMGTMIDELKTSLTGMTDAQKTATLSTIFGTEAVTGMLNLIEAGPAKFDEMTTSLKNSAGSSAEAAAIMKDNFAGAIQELSGAFETLQIKVSDALTPAIQWLAEKLTELVNWFNTLSPSTRNVIAVVGALAAALTLIGGPLLLLIGFLPQILSGLAALSTIAGSAGAALTVLTGPVGLVIAAIVGLIAIFVTLYNTNEDFRNKVLAIWNEISTGVSAAITAVTDFLRSKTESFAEFWQQIWPDLKEAFINIWNAISAFMGPMLNDIFSVMKWTFGLVVDLVKVSWETVKGLFDAGMKIVEGLLQVFAGAFTGDWEQLWNGVEKIFGGVWDGMKVTLKGAINFMGAIINKFIQSFNAIKIEIPAVDIPLVGRVGGFTIGMPQIPAIPSLDIGTNAVLSDGLAMIHRGEEIRPANVVGGGYRGDGGGAPTIVINAQYVDREAAERFATEVSKILGRRTGGTR